MDKQTSLLSRIDSAGIDELTQGFASGPGEHVCLACGFRTETGVVYPSDGALYDARRCLSEHVARQHGSAFAMLVDLDRSVTGLSEVQRKVLKLSWQGRPDTDARDELGVGSTSTVRNHRFQLREKQRQARVFLAMMALLDQRTTKKPSAPLEKYLPDGVRLVRMPSRDKDRRLVVQALAGRFKAGRIYTEKQVNALLAESWHDTAALRRYLVGYGHLSRTDDGRSYWIPEDPSKGQPMTATDRRSELKRLARETRPVAGVYRIADRTTGRSWVMGTANLKTMNGQLFQLEAGAHRNADLQAAWTASGKSAFTFEVLETVAPDTDDVKTALRTLLKRWEASGTPELQP